MKTASSGYHSTMDGWAIIFHKGEFSNEIKIAAEKAGLVIRERNRFIDIIAKGVKENEGNKAKQIFDRFTDFYTQATKPVKEVVSKELEPLIEKAEAGLKIETEAADWSRRAVDTYKTKILKGKKLYQY